LTHIIKCRTFYGNRKGFDVSMGKLIIDGNEVYEIDEECMKKKEAEKKKWTAPEKGGQRYDRTKNVS
jgi:hypothetical protein